VGRAYAAAVPGTPNEGYDLVGGRYRLGRYRGFRLVKAQAGWDVWRGTTRVGWEPTKAKAKMFVDEWLSEAPED
jgi:hypothetical protein